MSNSERQSHVDAVHGVASDMSTRAEPGVARALEAEAQKRGILRPGERMNSEAAHRLAAQTAREADARSRR